MKQKEIILLTLSKLNKKHFKFYFNKTLFMVGKKKTAKIF